MANVLSSAARDPRLKQHDHTQLDPDCIGCAQLIKHLMECNTCQHPGKPAPKQRQLFEPLKRKPKATKPPKYKPRKGYLD